MCCWVNIGQFAVFFLLSLFVVFKVRFTLDRSAVVTLSAFNLSMLIRTFNWALYLKTNLVPEEHIGNIIASMVDMMASILIWATLYYFVFEMRIVRDKLLA